MSLKRALPQLRKVARRTDKLELLVVYGSRAQGAASNQSDWDLGYLAGPGFDEADLHRRLSKALKTNDLDLVDLRHATGVLRFHAARDGVLVHEDTPGMFVTFREEVARFWCDAQPVIDKAHADKLAEVHR